MSSCYDVFAKCVYAIPDIVPGSNPEQALATPLNRGQALGHAKAIEVAFPVEEISQLAQHESHRKEIFRPIYHIHKWWANRLGSVFRGIVLGAISESNFDIWEGFYKKHDLGKNNKNCK